MRPAAHTLDGLGGLIGRLWAARGLQEVAAVLRDGARHLVGADGITLVLREGALCHYVDEDAIGPLWKGRRFPLEQCISGWAMLKRRQAVVPDILNDERIPQDAYRATFVKSLVMTPIRMREPIGALGAYWAERREPGEAELGTLQALADASANAISHHQQARAAEQRARVLVAALPGTAAWIRGAIDRDAEVSVADRFDTALRAFAEQRPDAVIVGYHFDEARPYRLIQAIRAGDRAVPLLMVRALPLGPGGSRDRQIRDSYAELGVNEYVVVDEKSAGREDAANRLVLAAAVKGLLAGMS